MLALVDGVPRLVNLAQALAAYVAHQVEVVTRRSEYRLRQARDRAHIVEGLLRAIDMLDAVIATIRASDDRAEARANLMAEPFSFSEDQANHILDMTLGRLTRLGRSELEEEMAELRTTIAELEAILGDPAELRGVIGDGADARSRRSSRTRAAPQIIHDPGRARHRGPDRGRADRRDPHAGRLHQGGLRRTRSGPSPAAAVASRGRG